MYGRIGIPLAFCRRKNKPNKLKILKSKEEKMSRETEKRTPSKQTKKTPQIQKNFQLPSCCQKPVTTGFHPNKRCVIVWAITFFMMEVLQGKVPIKNNWVTSVHWPRCSCWRGWRRWGNPSRVEGSGLRELHVLSSST